MWQMVEAFALFSLSYGKECLLGAADASLKKRQHPFPSNLVYMQSCANLFK